MRVRENPLWLGLFGFAFAGPELFGSLDDPLPQFEVVGNEES